MAKDKVEKDKSSSRLKSLDSRLKRLEKAVGELTEKLHIPPSEPVDSQNSSGVEGAEGASRIEVEDWSGLAELFEALGSQARLRILQAVTSGTQTVAGLAELSKLGSTGQIYHHVNLLLATGWLTSERRGVYTVPEQRQEVLATILSAASETV